MVCSRFSAQQGAQMSVPRAGQGRFALRVEHLGHLAMRLLPAPSPAACAIVPDPAAARLPRCEARAGPASPGLHPYNQVQPMSLPPTFSPGIPSLAVALAVLAGGCGATPQRDPENLTARPPETGARQRPPASQASGRPAAKKPPPQPA